MPAALNKAEIRRSFGLAADSYDSAAGLQRQIGRRLLEKFPLQAESGRILDVGCGTGFLTRLLADQCTGQPLLALDIAPQMLRAARLKNPGLPIAYVCADAEKLPFADRCLQQVYSNLALQWCQDLSAVFAGICRLLAPGGQWVFSTFGPATLHELRAAWGQVDDFVHVNDFFGIEQVRDGLCHAGFAGVECGTTMYTVRYPSVLALMRELKDLGAHNVNQARNRRLTVPGQLQRMIGHYENSMAGDGIVASYEIIFARARR